MGKVPGIYWSLTTPRVLVMEFCTGVHINDVENLKKQGVDVYDVSNKIGQMYSKMIFDDGYVHCDPHPGLNENLRRDRNSPAGPRPLHAALKQVQIRLC